MFDTPIIIKMGSVPLAFQSMQVRKEVLLLGDFMFYLQTTVLFTQQLADIYTFS